MSTAADDLAQRQGDGEGGFTLAHLVDVYRNLPPGTQKVYLRELVKAAPGLALKTVMPEGGDDEAVEVALRYKQLRVNHRAKSLLDESLTADAALDRPALVNLGDFLDQPDDPVRYRVDGLWPSGGRIVLAAQNKSGKTTMVGNLVRSLVDGDDFLGNFTVSRAERVVLLDNEMSPSQIRRWLRDQGIANPRAVDVVSLRGKLSTFNILDPATRTQWAQAIGHADVLVFDCLRPALDALALSEDKESGRFLEALDELVSEAGVSELVLVHHMGHTNERSRGDSRLEDWPDAKWKLVKEDADDPNSTRFFAAFGRDVDQPEVRLGFDPANRHLRVDGGSRRQARASEVEAAVQLFVEANPGCSGRAIEEGLPKNSNDVRKAVKSLIEAGWIRLERQGQKHAHFPSATPEDLI